MSGDSKMVLEIIVDDGDITGLRLITGGRGIELSYDDDGASRVGDVSISYWDTGRVKQIGDVSISYWGTGRVKQITGEDSRIDLIIDGLQG